MKRNIILMGLPGAGKGTQAERIEAAYKIPHISTGDMFRQAMADGTELGKKAKSYMDSGSLVPDEVTNGIVKDRLAQVKDDEGYMLDGFPRTINQAEALEEITASIDQPIDAVIYIDVDPDVLKQRLTDRIICRSCGATYNVNSNPPKEENTCDRCGSHDFYQREDDKAEVVENRIQVNLKQTTPLVEFYEAKGKLYKVPGDIGIENVFNRISEVIED